jgi:Amino acid permease
MAQLLLVALLIVVVVTAVAGSSPAARPANWTPFAPHGWLSIGRAAATLMLSFVGWEAVAPLTGRLRAGQLSRVIGIAFTVTAVLYLSLAVATVSCLGHGADLNVPLADLLQLAIGPAGRAVAAVAALVLTAGSVNAFISGATEMLRELSAVPGQNGPNGHGRPPRLSAPALLGIIALVGLLLIGLSALRLASPAGRCRRRRGCRPAQADGQLLVVAPPPEPADGPALLQPDRYRRRSSVMGEPRRAANREPVGRPYLSEGEAMMEEFTLGARAGCPDGFCGVVSEAVVDHLWGRKQVAIPVSAVASIDDGIRLNITKRQVEDLPPVGQP